MWKKIFKVTVYAFILVFILFNIMVYNQAYNLCHVSDAAGVRTHSEDVLTWKDKARLAITGVSNPKARNEYAPSVSHDTVLIQSNVRLEGWLLEKDDQKYKGTILLFPGYMASKGRIIQRGEYLHRQGYRVLMMDFMGAGGSEGNLCTIGYHEAQNVRDSYQYIATRFPNEKIFLFGTSMGAAAVLKALAEDSTLHPSGIVLECPYGTLYKAIQNRCALLNVPSFPITELLMFWGGVQGGFSPFAMNPQDFAQDVNIPALVIYGTQDERVHRSEIDNIFHALPHASKQLVLMTESGHDDFMRTEPQKWKNAVADFLGAR